MRRFSWRHVDFVGVIVNVIFGVLLLGGVVGGIMGPSPSAPEGFSQLSEPVPPLFASIDSSELCLEEGRLERCDDDGEDDAVDDDERKSEDRRGSNRGRH